MECSQFIYLSVPYDDVNYKLSLDDINMQQSPMARLMDNTEADEGPRATGDLFKNPNIEFELSAERNDNDCLESVIPEDKEPTRFCHICNVAVLKHFTKDHNQSKLHLTLLRLAHKAVERLEKHIQQQVTETTGTYYCTPCNKQIEVIEAHEKEKKHQALKRREDLMVTLLNMYTDVTAEHESYTDCTGKVINTTTCESLNDELEEFESMHTTSELMCLSLQKSCVSNNCGTFTKEALQDKPKNVLLTVDSPFLAMGSSLAEPVTEAFESNSVTHESDSIDVTDSKKTHEYKLVKTPSGKAIIENDLIDVRTKNGDWLMVPYHYFHCIGVSSNDDESDSETTASVMHCMLCKKKGMTETSVSMHIKSSMHTNSLQKLVLDYHGIRKIPNLFFNGQSLGHCVVCNFIVCNAAHHVASPQHQGHYKKMKKSCLNVQKRSVVHKADTHTATVTNKVLEEPHKIYVPQQFADKNNSSTDSGSGSIFASQCGNKQINTDVDNTIATAPNEKLGANTEESASSLPVITDKGQMNSQSEDDSILAEDLVELHTDSADKNKSSTDSGSGSIFASQCENKQTNTDVDNTIATAPNDKLGANTEESAHSLTDKGQVNSELEEDLVELHTENGVLLTVPQNHFNGIRISSHCINNPEIAATALRCMLCKERGLTQDLVKTHIKSSKHTDFVRNLALDKHGIRQVSNLIFGGLLLGHCVVCNFIVYDVAQHVASLEHQKHYSKMTKTRAIHTWEIHDIDNSASATNVSQDPNQHVVFQQTGNGHQSSKEFLPRFASQSECEQKNINVDSKNTTASTEKLEPKTREKLSFPRVIKSSKDCVNAQVEEEALPQDLVEVQSENGVLLTVPRNHFNGIQISSHCINNSETAASALRCILCKERGMTQDLVETHIKSSKHTDFVRNLALDKHGIRQVRDLIFGGLLLGHCVVCNFIVYDVAQHVASLEHQKHYSKMTKTRAIHTWEIHDVDNSASATNVSQDPNQHDVVQQTANSYQSSKDSLPRLVSNSEGELKNINVNSKNTTSTTEKLETKTRENDSFPLAIKTSKLCVNAQLDEETLPQDLVEVQSEDGVLLTVPRNHFNGIRISSHCINIPGQAAGAFALRCMLCKERGMTEALAESHITSHVHTDYVRKLVLDKHGIRQLSNLTFRDLKLGHCVVCNFIIYDAALHIQSPEHKKFYNMMRKSAGERRKSLDRK